MTSPGAVGPRARKHVAACHSKHRYGTLRIHKPAPVKRSPFTMKLCYDFFEPRRFVAFEPRRVCRHFSKPREKHSFSSGYLSVMCYKRTPASLMPQGTGCLCSLKPKTLTNHGSWSLISDASKIQRHGSSCLPWMQLGCFPRKQYVCIYIYIYMYVCMYIYIYIYTGVLYMCVYIYIYIYIFI